MSFIKRCLAGDAVASDIDQFVANWHAGEAGHDQTLHEYLGMTWGEYQQWATRPSVLPSILDARLNGATLADELAESEE
jgi:hypothetical protein